MDQFLAKNAILGSHKIDVLTTIALVVRALTSKWKQPLGYFLSSGPIKPTILKSLTKECIGKLEKTGLNVVGTVCDQGSNNRSFLHQMKNVALNKPYIKYGDKKILVLYYPTHLLKNIQNNLKKTDFEW